MSGGFPFFDASAATLASATQAAVQHTPMPTVGAGRHGYLTSAQEQVVSQQIVDQTDRLYDSLGPNNPAYYSDPRNLSRLLSPDNPSNRTNYAAAAVPSPLRSLNPRFALGSYYGSQPSAPAPAVQPPLYGGGGVTRMAAASSQGFGGMLALFALLRF